MEGNCVGARIVINKKTRRFHVAYSHGLKFFSPLLYEGKLLRIMFMWTRRELLILSVIFKFYIKEKKKSRLINIIFFSPKFTNKYHTREATEITLVCRTYVQYLPVDQWDTHTHTRNMFHSAREKHVGSRGKVCIMCLVSPPMSVREWKWETFAVVRQRHR